MFLVCGFAHCGFYSFGAYTIIDEAAKFVQTDSSKRKIRTNSWTDTTIDKSLKQALDGSCTNKELQVHPQIKAYMYASEKMV